MLLRRFGGRSRFRAATADPQGTVIAPRSGHSKMRRIEETFIPRKNREAVTKASAMAKPNLPGLTARRGGDFDLTRIGLILFNRLTAKTARSPNDLHGVFL
jgi:hypothetical protein